LGTDLIMECVRGAVWPWSPDGADAADAVPAARANASNAIIKPLIVRVMNMIILRPAGVATTAMPRRKVGGSA
jgi:hypothetical protein